MESPNPVWFTVAAIIAGCMALAGVGILFVRAQNIERRWLVSLSTLVGAGMGAYLLVVHPVWAGGQGVTVPWLAGPVSIFGFILGRAIDSLLGPRNPEAIRTNSKTFGADLAD
jgi:hypothetical protein